MNNAQENAGVDHQRKRKPEDWILPVTPLILGLLAFEFVAWGGLLPAFIGSIGVMLVASLFVGAMKIHD